MRTVAFVGMGSNLGHRLEWMQKGLRLLLRPGIRLLAASSLYETEPVGFVEQPLFLNAVVCLEVEDLSPWELLSLLQEVEQLCDRVRKVRWGPRTLDLDLLYFGGCKVQDERLTIPHPRIGERAFVLLPLQELSLWLTSEQLACVEKGLERVSTRGVRRVASPQWTQEGLR